MFSLTIEELSQARLAIEAHGYSTLLPEPQEWALVLEQWSEFAQAIAKKDLDAYKPHPTLRVFAPKAQHTVATTRHGAAD